MSFLPSTSCALKSRSMERSASARGFQNAGVTQAIQAAIAGQGAGQQADVLAREAQLTEQRKRDDLGLLLSLIINPSLQQVATASGLASNISSKHPNAGGGQFGSCVVFLVGHPVDDGC